MRWNVSRLSHWSAFEEARGETHLAFHTGNVSGNRDIILDGLFVDRQRLPVTDYCEFDTTMSN